VLAASFVAVASSSQPSWDATLIPDAQEQRSCMLPQPQPSSPPRSDPALSPHGSEPPLTQGPFLTLPSPPRHTKAAGRPLPATSPATSTRPTGHPAPAPAGVAVMSAATAYVPTNNTTNNNNTINNNNNTTNTTNTTNNNNTAAAASPNDEVCDLQQLVCCALAYDPRVNKKRARVLRKTACWLATSPRPSTAPYCAALSGVRKYIRYEHPDYWFASGFDRPDNIGELLRDPAARGIFQIFPNPKKPKKEMVQLDLVALSMAAALRSKGGVSSVREGRKTRTPSVPSVEGPCLPALGGVSWEASPSTPQPGRVSSASSGGNRGAATGVGGSALAAVAVAAAWAWPGYTPVPRLRRGAAMLLATVTAEEGVAGQPHTMLMLMKKLKKADRAAYMEWWQTPGESKRRVALLDGEAGGDGSNDNDGGGGGGAPAPGPFLRVDVSKDCVVSLDLLALLAAAGAATAEEAQRQPVPAAPPSTVGARCQSRVSSGSVPPLPLGSAAVTHQAGLTPVGLGSSQAPVQAPVEASGPYASLPSGSSSPSTASTVSGSGDCNTTVWHRMVTTAAVAKAWPNSDMASRVRRLSATALVDVREGPMGPWSMLWARMAAHIHSQLPNALRSIKSELQTKNKSILRDVLDESTSGGSQAFLRVVQHVHDRVVQLDVPALLRESLEQCINSRWGSAGEGDAETAVANNAKRCVVRLLAAAPPRYLLSFASLGAQVLKQCPRSGVGGKKLRKLCMDEQNVFQVSVTGKSHYTVRLVDSEILGLVEALAAAEVDARQVKCEVGSGSQPEAAAATGGSGGSGSSTGVLAPPQTMQEPPPRTQPPLPVVVSRQLSSSLSPLAAEACESRQASPAPAREAPAGSSQPPATRPVPIPIPIPISGPSMNGKEKDKCQGTATPYISPVPVLATKEPTVVQPKTADVSAAELRWLLGHEHPGGKPCSWAAEVSTGLPPVAVQNVVDPYSHEATAMLSHCRACTLVGLSVESYGGECPVLVVLYAPAMAAWPATVYLVDCTACTAMYDEHEIGMKMAGELLDRLQELLGDPAVTKVVHGCQQVRCLETACGGGAVTMPLVDTRILLNGMAFMMGLPPPAPPPSSSIHDPAFGAASPPSERLDLRADVTAVHEYVSRMYNKLKEMGLWADRPGLLEALMKLHFAALRSEVVFARARQGGDNGAAAAVEALALARPLGQAQVAAATGAVVTLPEIWMAMVEEAVLWVAVHAPLYEMTWRRGAGPPPAEPMAAAAAAMAAKP
ncbi:hypothetical protein Vafri_15503, partial [Volvox africanus]